ncbi:MAG TPA: STAS domain-containing protein [Bacillota bacterium]|nr:STAS domain-containing protein [Bacillota bacterium]
MHLTFDTLTDHQQTIIRLQGEIDVYTAPNLKDALMPLVKVTGQHVLVDCQKVTYMDSTGLGVFIGALKATKSYGSRMTLINLQERIYRLFTITGLDQVMDVNLLIKGGNE